MGGEEGKEGFRVHEEQREGSGRRGNAGSGRTPYKGLAAILSTREIKGPSLDLRQ